MPAAGLREIDKTLRKVDEGIREFSARYEQNRGASGPSGEREAHREALRKAHAALQKHGAQIKRWTSQGDESWKSARTRLEDALAKIEDATRRMAELEAAEGEDGAKAPVAAAQPLQGEAAEAEQGANEPSSHKVQADQLLRDACDDSDMLEEFVCKICQVYVVDKPKLTRCSHLFCGDCIKKWFAAQPGNQTWAQRAQQAGAVPCPVCKEPLNEQKDLFPVSAGGGSSSAAMLWRMLCGLKICCANSAQCRPADGRCDWTGEYGAWQKHIRRCQNVPLSQDGQEAGGASSTTTPACSPEARPATPPFAAPPVMAALPEEAVPEEERPATPPAAAPPAVAALPEDVDPEAAEAAEEAPASGPPAAEAAGAEGARHAAASGTSGEEAPEPQAQGGALAAEAPQEKKAAKEKAKKKKDAKADASPEAPVGAEPPVEAPPSSSSSAQASRPPQEPDAVIASAEAAVSGGDLSAALAALVQLKARQWTREHADAAGTAGASAATAAAASAVGRRPQQTQQAAALAQASAVAAAAAASPVLTRKQQQQQMLQQQRHQAMMQQQQLRQQQLHHQQLQQQLHAQQLQQHQAMLLQRAQAAQAAQAAAQQKQAAAQQAAAQQAAAQQAAAQQAAAQQAAAQQAAQQRRVADIGPPATIPAEEAETGKVMKVLTRFDGSSDASQLQLQPGDSVAVLEQHASGWVFGRKVEKGGADDPEGWFPLWALQSR